MSTYVIHTINYQSQNIIIIIISMGGGGMSHLVGGCVDSVLQSYPTGSMVWRERKKHAW